MQEWIEFQNLCALNYYLSHHSTASQQQEKVVVQLMKPEPPYSGAWANLKVA